MAVVKTQQYTLHANVWLYPGESGNWRFVTVPKKVSAEIKKRFGLHARGWGSLPVEVTIGKTTWLTSIFPDSKSGTYMLPLKAAVRKKEGIFVGDAPQITLRILYGD